MMFPFLSIFIIFLVILTVVRIRTTQREKEEEKAFWQREADANTVRKKDISALPYIAISCGELPFGVAEDPRLSEYEAKIRDLAENKILNLSGMTNTDLKMKYGAPNLPFLMECDQNYTELVRTMHFWGQRLEELSLHKEASCVLYQSVRWGSDLKSTYELLAGIYHSDGNDSGIRSLKEYANCLHSLRKNDILKTLENF